MRKVRRSLLRAALPLFMLPLCPASAHEVRQRPKIDVPAALRQKSSVCTDGKGHYVVITPDDPERSRYTEVYYGDGKRFVEVPPYKGLTRTLFRDPRFYNGRAPAPEGYSRREDKRLLSGITLEDGKCSMWCGERDKALSVLEPAKAQALLQGAAFLPNPRQWEPHALARDDEGNYYFVDHGAYADAQKSFRLFIGRKGAMKVQPITEVISDSGGDVLITKAGTLSLPRGGGAVWKVGGKPTSLVRLTLDEGGDDGPKNVLFVYGELGVYRGDRLGTPCDDI